MKPDPQQPGAIGRMAQNFEAMNRKDTLHQIAVTLVRVGLFLLGGAFVLCGLILTGAL